jgi:hypothetical protein
MLAHVRSDRFCTHGVDRTQSVRDGGGRITGLPWWLNVAAPENRMSNNHAHSPRLVCEGAEIVTTMPEQICTFMRGDVEKWARR